MALLTALLTSAAVTSSLVAWNDSRPFTAGDDATRPFDVATSTDGASNDTDYFRFPTSTSSEIYFRLAATTTRGPDEHLRSQRVAIARSIRLYGIVVAACLAAVVAVALTAACVVAHGAAPSAGGGDPRGWESWFRRGGSWCGRLRRRSTAADLDAAATSGAGDGDYIYRPLGTGTGSGLDRTGSALDDEYETTFVGVSVPLLRDVRAV